VTLIAPGHCRYCGCSEEDPCSLCRRDHDGCAWHDRARTVCSAGPCSSQYENALAASRAAARPRRRTSAEIYQLQVEERRTKRRLYRLRKRGRAA
jgi:hypothetical protein